MLLQLDGLGRRFGDLWAFRSVSLSANVGEIISLVGPNGAGKTTLLKVLSTLLTPSEGKGTVAGFGLEKSPSKVRAAISWVPATERGFFNRLTGLQNLRFHGALLGLRKQNILDLLRELNGESLSPALEAALSTPYYLCSAGMRQSLHLSRALLSRPQVLLLDEPTRSLDAETRLQMWALFRKASEQSLVILASHSPVEISSLNARSLSLTAEAPR